MMRAVAAVVVGLEALALVAAGLVLGVDLFLETPASVVAGLFLAVLVLLFGAALVPVALGLWRGRRWSRAPAATWQLLQASIALPDLGLPAGLRAGLLVACAVVLVTVLRSSLFDAPPPD